MRARGIHKNQGWKAHTQLTGAPNSRETSLKKITNAQGPLFDTDRKMDLLIRETLI